MSAEAKITIRSEEPAAGPAAPLAPAAPMSQAVVASSSRLMEFAVGNVKYVVRWLSAAERMRVFRAIGPENAGNQAYASYCLVLASISHINGEPESIPTSWREFEALATRIGDDAFEKIEDWMVVTGQDRQAAKIVQNAKN